MVAKWLLEKLKASENARASIETWKTLQSTFRLLSPERQGNLLAPLMNAKPLSFLQITTIALKSSEVPYAMLSTLSELFDQLLQLSKTPSGALVKATLGVPAEKASAFLGAWLQSIHDIAIVTPSPVILHSALRPAAEIWALRKRSSEDDAHFAASALVPAARCLSLGTANAQATQSLKRKRQDEVADDLIVMLLAKHIFLPARNTFFRDEAPTASKARSTTVKSQKPSSTLVEFLKPLKDAIASAKGLNTTLFESFSRLLEIALRCSPTATPRQRSNEQPWVEASFTALYECNQTEDGKTVGRASFLQMLCSVERRGRTLSKETLRRLVRSEANFGRVSEDRLDWEAIAQIVRLDAALLTEDKYLGALCSGITGTVLRMKASEVPLTLRSATMLVTVITGPAYLDPKDFLKDRVAVPLMQASAKNRSLHAFVDAWRAQLTCDHHNQMSSTWLELDTAFQDLVEEAFTERQVLELFDSLAKDLRTAPKDTEKGGNASIVILNALLGGITDTGTLDSLQSRLEQLLDDLLDALGNRPDLSHLEVRAFALARRAFELWYPSWAAMQGQHSVLSRAKSILDSRALGFARKACAIPTHGSKTGTPYDGMIADASSFVASVCAHLCGFEQAGWSTSCSDVLAKECAAGKEAGLEAAIEYPRNLGAVDSQTRLSMVDVSIKKAAAIGFNEHPQSAAFQHLSTIADQAVRSVQPAVIEDLVQSSLQVLSRLQSSSGKTAEEKIVLGMLLRIAPASLTRAQREKLVDAVTELQCRVKAPDMEHLHRRFVLLVHLTQSSNATSQLSTDADCIWRLARSMTFDGFFEEFEDQDQERADDETQDLAPTPGSILELPPETREGAALVFLEQLAVLTLKHLLATQDQERSRSMLMALSASAVENIGSIGKTPHQATAKSTQTLVKTIIHMLEAGAKEDLAAKLGHRKIKASKIEKMWSSAMNRLVEHQNGKVESSELSNLLDAICGITDSLNTPLGLDVPALVDPLLKSMQTHLDDRAVDGESENVSEDTQSAPCQLFALSCKHAKDDNNVLQNMTSLVQKRLSPQDLDALLTVFAQRLAKSDDETRVRFALQLISNTIPTTSEDMLLVESCLSGGARSDSDDKPDRSPTQRLLNALLDTALRCKAVTLCRRALHCVALVLKDMSRLVNQLSVEATMKSMRQLAQRSSLPSVTYLDICSIVSVLLLHHRSRLQGRFHEIVQLFQPLLSRLFQHSSSRTSKASPGGKLSAKHARAFAKLLVLFCEPPQFRRQTKASDLVDKAREEQAHVGQYMQYLLHLYCSEILTGTLGAGMREALQPGFWSVMKVMEMHDEESMKAVSAAMDNNERAVLRGVYDDYSRFGKWQGG